MSREKDTKNSDLLLGQQEQWLKNMQENTMMSVLKTCHFSEIDKTMFRKENL
jgi:hypothetical protein